MPGLVPGSSVRTLRSQRSEPAGTKQGTKQGNAQQGKASWPPARDVIASATPRRKAKAGRTEDANAKQQAKPAVPTAAARPAIAKQPAAAKTPGKQPAPIAPIKATVPGAPGGASRQQVHAAGRGPGGAPGQSPPLPLPPGVKHGVLPALSRPPRPPRAQDAASPGASTSSSNRLASGDPRAPCAPADIVEARKKPNGTTFGGRGRQRSAESPAAGADGDAVSQARTAPPEGKAAWQERERERDRERGERRQSACEAGINHRVKSTEARRRWMRRNRIHDTAFGGSSSDEDDIPFPFGHESAAANALLYVGLGTVAVGMVIAFVGTGEKGFKTLELRLIGPTLIAGGVLCCLLRVMLCVCPSKCLLKRFRQRSRHKKQVMALEAAGRIAMGPMGRNLPPRHGHHGMRGPGLSRSGSRAGSRSGSRHGSRPPSRVSRAPSELIRSPSDPNDPTVSGLRGKKRVSIASASGGPSGSGVGAGVHRPGSSGLPSSQSSQVLAATSLFLQNEQQASQACRSGGRLGLGFTVPSINLPSLVRGRTSSEDLGDGYVASSVRRLSQSSKRLGSTGDLPLLAAVDVDADADGFDIGDVASCSFNSAFSPDDSRPGPSSAPSTSHVHAPHAIIVTSPTPSSSPRPATRGSSAGSSSGSGSGSAAPSRGSSAGGDRDRPTREIILSPGGLGLQ
ncbi:Mothers against decapentaplegic-like protein 1 [Frankliniella fusca]|uniref:Mothers against decapentaplegic-like protein 1 n=1 Tax=Frankliniella fusca TaxID=407009 RepID=A0AAE1I0S0_9NEOP|nr:Mothers against decapentaplegic-like protein 1 [Frankliniella fusca]